MRDSAFSLSVLGCPQITPCQRSSNVVPACNKVGANAGNKSVFKPEQSSQGAALKAGKNCRLHNDLTCAFNSEMPRKRRM